MPGIPFVGHWELIVLGIVLLLLIGPKALPRVARRLGGGIREVRREVSEVTAPVKETIELEPKRDADA